MVDIVSYLGGICEVALIVCFSLSTAVKQNKILSRTMRSLYYTPTYKKD